MADYLTTYETALAVVATAMKKARLRPDILIVNSFMGGLLFSTGGMLHSQLQAGSLNAFANNPGLVKLFDGVFYSIGLFFVVIMGADLFNSNVLFFSTGLCRRAITIVDLLISFIVSWAFNLVGNIFVCGIFCYLSKVSRSADFVEASSEIIASKAAFSFAENLLRGMAGNFFVCLAIYLQLMVRPLHVKFLMLVLPTFSFVFIGFSHAIADMTVIILAYSNGAPIGLGTMVWKVLIPVTIGNVIGGSFFGVVVVWFLHIFSVEQDQKKLNLPKFEVKDEQPQQNMDSRVVAQIPRKQIEEEEEQEEEESVQFYNPETDLAKVSSRATGMSRFSTRSKVKSPKNVFPVYGMGQPSERERKIAGFHEDEQDSLNSNEDDLEKAEYTSTMLRNVISRRKSTVPKPSVSMSLPTERRQSSSSIYNTYTVNRNHATKNNAETRPSGMQPSTSTSTSMKLTSSSPLSIQSDEHSDESSNIDPTDLRVKPLNS